MSYYQGDFYTGDPGFFSSLAQLGKTALGFIPGGGAVTSLARVASGTLAARGGMKATGAALARRAGGAVIRHPVLTAAGAAGVIGGGGFALGKHAKMLRHNGLHKHRRMNPYNPRALRRAVRRAMAFSRMARRVLRFTHPKLARGRVTFRTHAHKK